MLEDYEEKLAALVKAEDYPGISKLHQESKKQLRNAIPTAKEKSTYVLDFFLLRNAIKFGNLAIVKYAIEKCRVDPDCESSKGSGRTALYMASEAGKEDIVDYLISLGVTVNTHLKENGMTPLMAAASVGVARSLIKARVKLEMTDEDGYTALHHACYDDKLGVVAALIAAEANLNARTLKGYSAFITAASKGNIDILKALKEAGANVHAHTVRDPGQGNVPVLNAVTAAAMNGHCAAVRYLLSLNVDINFRYSALDITPLSFAIHNKKDDVVELLIAEKANLEITESTGHTALVNALAVGSARSVKLLLEGGANPNVLSGHNYTPLRLALEKKPLELEKIDSLLAHGANISITTQQGIAAVGAAVKSGSGQAVKKILMKQLEAAKGNLEQENHIILFMLGIVIYIGERTVLNFLLSEERYKALMMRWIGLVLEEQIRCNSVKGIKLLLEDKHVILQGTDANINNDDIGGMMATTEVTINGKNYDVLGVITPLMVAAMRGNVEVVKLLLSAKAEIGTIIEAEPKEESEPKDETEPKVEELSKIEAEPKASTENPMSIKLTALICAQSSGNEEVVVLLLSRLVVEALREQIEKNIKGMRQYLDLAHHFSKLLCDLKPRFDEESNLWINLKDLKDAPIPQNLRKLEGTLCIPVSAIADVVQKIWEKNQLKVIKNISKDISKDSSKDVSSYNPLFWSLICFSSHLKQNENPAVKDSVENDSLEVEMQLHKKLRCLDKDLHTLQNKIDNYFSRIEDLFLRIGLLIKTLDKKNEMVLKEIDSLQEKFEADQKLFAEYIKIFEEFYFERNNSVQEIIKTKAFEKALAQIGNISQSEVFIRVRSGFDSIVEQASKMESRLGDIRLRLDRQVHDQKKTEIAAEKAKERSKKQRKAELQSQKQQQKESKQRALAEKASLAKKIEEQKAHEERLAAIREQKKIKQAELESAQKSKEALGLGLSKTQESDDRAAKRIMQRICPMPLTLSAKCGLPGLLERLEAGAEEQQQELWIKSPSLIFTKKQPIKEEVTLDKTRADEESMPDLEELSEQSSVSARLAGSRPLKIVFE